MNPVAMLSLMVAAFAAFGWTAWRRWVLLRVGQPEGRFDRPQERLLRVLRFGLGQQKMYKYRAAGLSHHLVFLGFVVLLLRTLMLWGRGFFAGFNFFFLAPGLPTNVLGVEIPFGDIYSFAKDSFALLVIAGCVYFFWMRLVVGAKRLTHSGEALLILGIIVTMMVADITYDASSIVLHRKLWTYGALGELTARSADVLVAARSHQPRNGVVEFELAEPVGSLLALALAGVPPQVLAVIGQVGFWTHSILVLVFLNLLPYSKHFHVITGLPNIYFSDLTPPGRLRPLAVETPSSVVASDGGASEAPKPASEIILERIGDVTDPDKNPEPVAVAGLGAGRIEHLSWKHVLDLYTCTECGRCTDNCPAHLTGKMLSPKHLTLDLRDHLYRRESEFVDRDAVTPKDSAPADAMTLVQRPLDLCVPSAPETGVIHPDVLWACTSCRACEDQCPVLISYVDKIVDMRRNLVMVRGEFPADLQRPFQGIEVNGNPWNLSRLDRAAWSDGLDVPTVEERPDAKVLYWVGCAASYDDRAKKIARAMVRLLKAANVDFAILGQRESCTGDAARRAGNEFLFATMAEQNVATLKDVGAEKKLVLTTCPHCFNTLKHEYRDFGIELEVVNHTDYLLGLLDGQKLSPTKKTAERLVFHDSCYLGRYNDVYDSPREILKRIGAELVEANMSRERGMCCGAGGAQMWMEEGGTERVNKKRTLQLLETKPKAIASACPFCMTMLTDGLKAENREDDVRQLDVAELLLEACVD